MAATTAAGGKGITGPLLKFGAVAGAAAFGLNWLSGGGLLSFAQDNPLATGLAGLLGTGAWAMGSNSPLLKRFFTTAVITSLVALAAPPLASAVLGSQWAQAALPTMLTADNGMLAQLAAEGPTADIG